MFENYLELTHFLETNNPYSSLLELILFFFNYAAFTRDSEFFCLFYHYAYCTLQKEDESIRALGL